MTTVAPPEKTTSATDILRARLRAVEQQMQGRLAELRSTFEHSGMKGDSAEETVRAFLRSYLPRNKGVGYGEVIDSFANRSNQCDIVITNDNHPGTYTEDQPGLFFIEGVSAVGEVKSQLTSEEFKTSLESAARFKKLTAQGRGIQLVEGKESDKRYLRCPPWFLFAYESQVTLDWILNTTKEFQEKHNLDYGSQADAICVLDRGLIANMGDGQGSLQYLEDGIPLSGWVDSETNRVLFDFLAWLSITMPRTSTLTPILPNYLVEDDSNK